MILKLKKKNKSIKKLFKNDTYRVQFYYLFLKCFVKVKDNTILYESHHGKSMNCNPYAIYLYMINNEKFKDYTHIWILNDIDKKTNTDKTKFVKRNSLKNAYYLLVSKYLINNTTFLTFFTKSKKQTYINTWHGTPLKTLGKDSNLGYGIQWNVTRNLLQTDFLISPNSYATEKLLQSSDVEQLFSGKIIENGYPRNDFLRIPEKEKIELKKQLKINNNKKTILYAPTFRGSHMDAFNIEEVFIDFINNLKKDFSDEFNILIKLHHINNFNQENSQSQILNNTDINLILSFVDILITDYSSVSFDFFALKRPIIYYVFDFDEYLKDRGCYLPFEEMPGIVCKKKEEVYHAIMNSETIIENNNEIYNKSIEKYSKYDKGYTSQNIVEYIFNNKEDINIYSIKNNHKKKILIYGGAFMLNGVTSSLLALLSNISYDKYEVYIITDLGPLNLNLQRVLKSIPQNVKIIYSKQYLLKYILFISRISNKIFTSKQKNKISEYIAYNILGDSKFDIAIDYSGYGIYWANIIAFTNSSKKYIYLHSDMKSEAQNKRFKYFEQIYKLYDEKYDKLITVSSTSKLANKSKMSKLANKIECVHNSINPNNIIDCSNDTKYIDNFINSEKQKILFSKENINFINIGRYSIEKGQEKLIKAFALLFKEYSNINLFIVGHGPLEKNLKELISELKMENNIILTGKMDNPYSLLKKCDCFVLSSDYEGQGLVLLESLVLNIPCISTDIPGPRSILSSDQGLLVQNNIDALRDGMKKYIQGEIKYKNFDYNKYVNNCMNEFYSIIT